jgi:hypothetical protein
MSGVRDEHPDVRRAKARPDEVPRVRYQEKCTTRPETTLPPDIAGPPVRVYWAAVYQ